jgi:hypothetical protein
MKAIYDIDNARVILEDDSEACFYTDKFNVDPDYPCSEETIQTVVQMFNSGSTLMEIDEFLLNDETCSQDVREEIVEGLYKIYEKDLAN